MSTTTRKRRYHPTDEKYKNMGREQLADVVLPMLSADGPISAHRLARELGLGKTSGSFNTKPVDDALRVLETRGLSKRVMGGWTTADSKLAKLEVKPREYDFPYHADEIGLDEMFVDVNYQRPITSLAARIERDFDPGLFGTLILSDRGEEHQPRRYAIIDGQTRWYAAQRVGAQSGPAIIFENLTPQDEAKLFWRYQKERRGVLSWYQFRARLASGDEQAIRVKNLVESVGYKVGGSSGELKAVAALEACFRRDEFTLERVLSDLREAWPTLTPDSKVIRGLHYFFLHYPVDRNVTSDVDDERLITRLKVAGPDGLIKKQQSVKDVMKGSSDKIMAMAIQATYLSGNRDGR